MVGQRELKRVIFFQFAAREGEERQNNQRAINHEAWQSRRCCEPICLTRGREHDAQPRPTTKAAADQRDAPFVVRHPGGAVADRVGDVRGDEHSAERDDGDRQQPEIPGHDESGELVEAELGPLIDAAFERHAAAQINDDGRLRNVEKQNREQPKEKMRLSELRRGADPARADNKENLRQNEIAETERLFVARRYAVRRLVQRARVSLVITQALKG